MIMLRLTRQSDSPGCDAKTKMMLFGIFQVTSLQMEISFGIHMFDLLFQDVVYFSLEQNGEVPNMTWRSTAS